MVLYPNKLPESERVCFGICIRIHNSKFNGFEHQIYSLLMRMTQVREKWGKWEKIGKIKFSQN